jgi:GT2 family glycosyltransferase
MSSECLTTARPPLVISIVSHGQGELIRPLLLDLRPLAMSGVGRVIVTLNLPEPERFLEDAGYEIEVIRNARVKGFGANHNQAFAHADGEYFAVLNPDVRLNPAIFADLLEEFATPTVGVCAPAVTAPSGRVEDSARKFPSLRRIGVRMLKRLLRVPISSDYTFERGATRGVEWVAGMLMLFRATAFRAVGGFDERYFMYLEDADICRRLWDQGWRVLFSSRQMIVHDARRATLRNFKHFRWHVTSLARFLLASRAI